MSILGSKVTAPIALSLLVPALGLVSCSGSSSPNQIGGGAFLVLGTYPENNGRVYLNESVRITFTNPVDLATANFNSVAFLVRDANGAPLAESVVGTFRHGKDDAGKVDSKILEFVPRIPTNDTYTDGGFRPGRQYVLSLVNATNNAAPTLRDNTGRPISDDTKIRGMTFTTTSGATPQELFLDRAVGGPRVTSVDVSPKFGDRVSLNELGGVPVEVAIKFNQALNPASSNVPLRQPLAPAKGNARKKGRIFLEYDDPELGKERWIRAEVEMPVNDLVSSTVTLRPDGVLPNDTEVRVIVESTLQDISGESNIRDPNFLRVVAKFMTEKRYATQFDAVVFDFETSDLSDADAAFRDPVADLANGELKASFNFEGVETPLNYEPTSASNVLSTDFTQLVPSNGLPFDVSGGVFKINDINIKQGVTVRGVGTNPMVWLASGNVRVDGHLHVNGGLGGQVDTLNGANFPTSGGQGVCTGGNGGQGSPNTANSTRVGQDGAGPFQRPGLGGKGGRTACGTTSGYGAGGGGGSHAEVGDDNFTKVYDQDSAASGKGGNGTNGSIGGDPMPKIFSDQNDDNDFWGRTLDAKGDVLIGELKSPRGGGGGGGGGDRTPSAACSAGASFFNDEKGGGGGGGGGVLIIKALGTITIGPEGLISANGGFGGGGEDAGGCRQGGGGGGGAAGMVVLEASQVIIHQHNDTWAKKDTKFAIAADGGIGSHTAWQTTGRFVKYQTADGRVNRGGFGGMGIVQILTPAGRDTDGTGNVQDDNIVFLDTTGKPIANKLAWLNQGDIRPDPILLPATYGRTSSWISRYVSTGASVRRVVSSANVGTRSTTGVPQFEPSAKSYGPDYYFAGLIKSGDAQGYLDTELKTGLFDFPMKKFNGVDRFTATAMEPNATTYRGIDAHRIRIGTASFPSDGSLTNMSVRLLNAAGAGLADFRILSHTSSELLVDARDGFLVSGASQIAILEKFFDVVTEGNPGLGQTYGVTVGGQTQRYPIANVQIGFAFHKDPADADITGGVDKNRFPQNLDEYLYNLEDTGASSPREMLRKLHYPFVKVKVRFNLNYNYLKPDTQPGDNPVSSLSQRPALRFLRVPYAY